MTTFAARLFPAAKRCASHLLYLVEIILGWRVVIRLLICLLLPRFLTVQSVADGRVRIYGIAPREYATDAMSRLDWTVTRTLYD